jgi:DUF1707 SHOCT-like domain
VRLSDADREQLFDLLGRHAAAGRIDLPELERRVAVVAAAQTREEASAVTADLPPLAGPASTERRPRWGKGHGDADRPAPDWQPTTERFRDPRSNRVMRVWVDTGGGRHYVPDEGS